jgi:hypothetical protein
MNARADGIQRPQRSQQDVSDWAAIEAQIDGIVQRSGGAFALETVAQVRDFLQLIRGRCRVPRVSKGYWNTISFAWDETVGGPIEVEVFKDRLEVYRFFNQRTDIRHTVHAPGEPFPQEFVNELPLLP